MDEYTIRIVKRPKGLRLTSVALIMLRTSYPNKELAEWCIKNVLVPAFPAVSFSVNYQYVFPN